MRDLKNKLTSSKNTKNIQNRKGKSFGYQVLGFGAGDSGPAILDYLVIAGGGSAGAGDGCGGGAGGYLTGFADYVESVTYTVTVGNGGPGATSSDGSFNKIRGNAGNNSVLSGGGLSLTSIAGGFGGCGDAPGRSGGAGGSGGGGPDGGGSGTSGQGFDGATGGNSGGGGASEQGNRGNQTPAKKGGDGLSSSITGSAVTRAGGGGGFGGGPGGAGGGTDGAPAGNQNTANCPANTGGASGGTDGGTGQTTVTGNGGSGVVILSMPDSSYSGNTTGSPTVATGVSGRTVLTFTGSGTYVS